MTNIPVSNSDPKPVSPATPQQQTQGNPKPADKPSEQQK